MDKKIYCEEKSFSNTRYIGVAEVMHPICSSAECLNHSSQSSFALPNPNNTFHSVAANFEERNSFEKDAFNHLDMSTTCDCTYQHPTKAQKRNLKDKKETAFIKISTDSNGKEFTTGCNWYGCDKKALFWIKSPKNNTRQKAYLFAQSSILSLLMLLQIPGTFLKEIGYKLNLRGETVEAGFFGISLNIGGGFFNALGKIAQLGTPTLYKKQKLKFKRRYKAICCLNTLRNVCNDEMISSCYILAILGAAADLGVCFSTSNSGPLPNEWLNKRNGNAPEGIFCINKGFLFRELVSYNLECRGRDNKPIGGKTIREIDKCKLNRCKLKNRHYVLIFCPICLKRKSVAVIKPAEDKSYMIQINMSETPLEVKPYSFREIMG